MMHCKWWSTIKGRLGFWNRGYHCSTQNRNDQFHDSCCKFWHTCMIATHLLHCIIILLSTQSWLQECKEYDWRWSRYISIVCSHRILELILELNGTICWELVPCASSLVVLHMSSIISFHLRWCMLGVFVFDGKSNLFREVSLWAKLI